MSIRKKGWQKFKDGSGSMDYGAKEQNIVQCCEFLCQKIPTMTGSEIAEFKKMAKKCMMQDPHYKDVITSWVHPDGRILVENIQLNPE